MNTQRLKSKSGMGGLGKVGVAGVVILIAAVVIFSGALNSTFSAIDNFGNHTTAITTTKTASEGQVTQTQKIAFSAIDTLSGPQSALASAVISIYNSAGLKIDGCTLSSNACTSSTPFTSGSTITVGLAVANYETAYYQETVPYANAGNTAAFPMVIPAVLVGTGVLLVTIAGVTIGSNSTKGTGAATYDASAANLASKYGEYNFTKSAVSSATVTVQVANTAANSGWLGVNDPTNGGLQTDLVLGIANSNGSLATSNIGGRFLIGTTYNWAVMVGSGLSIASGSTTGIVTAPGFSSQTVGNGAQNGGTWTTSYAINKGTLVAAGGQCEKVTYTVYSYANVGYYQSNGSPGPNYATLVAAYTNWYCA